MANAERGGAATAGGAGGAGVATVGGDQVGGGTGALRVVLWLVAAVLAVRQLVVVLSTPRGERLTDLETWIGPHGVLHVTGSLYDTELYDTGTFTGTPFAGLVLRPLADSAAQALGVAWTFGTLLLVVALGLVAARALPGPVARRTSLLAAPVAICLLMLSLPVRTALHLGQTSVIPVLLVLLGCFAVRGERAVGLLIGVGAALQPTVLLFAPLLWLTGRRRTAVATGATFATATALAWAALSADSWTYWVHHIAGAGLGAHAGDVTNQSLHGALLRLGLQGPLRIGLFLTLGAAVVVIGLRRAVRYARDGQLLLAVALTGCVAVAVSPTAWPHQLLWVLLAVVGRVGTKARDRYVWPVAVVVVLTLPAKMLVPNVALLNPVRDNALLLMALVAACAVPFLSRAAPHYQRPEPTQYVAPVPSRPRWVPLLPFWRRALNRPNVLLELLLIRVGYSVYQQTRLMATGSRASAEEHAARIHAVEQALTIDIEHWFNHLVVDTPWLKAFLNFYYTSFHFVLPMTVLAVLYARRPAQFRWARTSLGFATVLALVGFWLFPLAPPRLMPAMGFVDTVHGVQDVTRPDYGAMTSVTNQYAAMPSLHFGWSLWCGLVIALLAPKLWMKLLGLLHPTFTLLAIVGTANHWVLDAAGGATVVGTGFALTYVLTGPRQRYATTPEPTALPGAGGGSPPTSPEPESASIPGHAPEPAPANPPAQLSSEAKPPDRRPM